jgi:hypothetical protein
MAHIATAGPLLEDATGRRNDRNGAKQPLRTSKLIPYNICKFYFTDGLGLYSFNPNF